MNISHASYRRLFKIEHPERIFFHMHGAIMGNAILGMI